MNKQLTISILLVACLWAGAAAAATKPFVIDNNNGKISGDALVATDAGDLQLQIGGATRIFKRGSYKAAFVPKPNEVELLEKALDLGKHDVIQAKAGDIFDKYKYLGWGGHVAYIEAIAQLADDKAPQALRTIQQGERYAGMHGDELKMGKAKVLMALDKTAEAEALLAQLKKAEGPDVAAFAFNMSGQILAKQGKKKEAVLQYMKTLLVFEPGTVNVERQEAKKQAVALLREMGDPRFKQIQQME
jgi:predicted negative regulator of RcsB-dependent stress response